LNRSLFYVLSSQHGDQFTPVRCNEQTLKRLVRYFEDVVTENKLSAMVLEGRCLDGDAARETERFARLVRTARHVYLFSCGTDCQTRSWSPPERTALTHLGENDYHLIETGPFILVMDPRFCGLLASAPVSDDARSHVKTYEMLWAFDPNVVFSAIEYLMGRVTVQRPLEISRFSSLLNSSTPNSITLRLALTVTTKLTMLMQRQNELEMAINRISSAITNNFDLEPVLQTAVEEVGITLNALRAAIVLWEEGTNRPEGMSVYARPEDSTSASGQGNGTDLNTRPSGDEPVREQPPVAAETNSRGAVDDNDVLPPALEIPVAYRNNVIGMLVVEDNTPGREWEDEEVLMVHTVSDQLAVAIAHARLFRQMQNEAMTDALTGLYNYGYLQQRLEREIKLADRNGHSLSVILLDLDHLKWINDTHGHQSGDAALRYVARVMKATVREVDVCTRYGGEEFVVLLPQCDAAGARDTAERLREAIASSPVPKVGQVTASLGYVTYPGTARTKEELIETADRGMYLAKASGRNLVRSIMHQDTGKLNA
jgi:diguanylate cyclase (GGDEF)-like protein